MCVRIVPTRLRALYAVTERTKRLFEVISIIMRAATDMEDAAKALGMAFKALGKATTPLLFPLFARHMQVPFSSACYEKGALQWPPKVNDTKG